jgi:hypothetical protein
LAYTPVSLLEKAILLGQIYLLQSSLVSQGELEVDLVVEVYDDDDGDIASAEFSGGSSRAIGGRKRGAGCCTFTGLRSMGMGGKGACIIGSLGLRA